MATHSRLAVYTAHASYPGPDRLDVSLAPWAPVIRHDVWHRDVPWPEYADAYTEQMRGMYRRDKGKFDGLLQGKRVVLTCWCLRPDRCHRTVLARILTRLDACYYGEIEDWDETVEPPVYVRNQ